MGEVDRYQGLVKERDQLNARWDEQNNLLVQSHERVIQDLTEEYDQKLQEEQVSAIASQIRSLILYPIELQARFYFYTLHTFIHLVCEVVKE